MPQQLDPAVVEALMRLMRRRTGGPIEAGNVDLYAQPQVLNPDGSISTVDSSSYGFDDGEVLLPSVTPDGRHLRNEADIVGEYERTGRHLGKFGTPDDATAYASRLHEDYARGAYARPGKPNLSVNGTPIKLAPSHGMSQQIESLIRMLGVRR